jgi:hypothetical protein
LINKIPVRTLQVDTNLFPFLHDLPLAAGSKQTQILIGQNNSEALLPLEVRNGSKSQPFAVKTLFGWSVNGPASLKPSLKPSFISNLISTSSTKVQSHFLGDIKHELDGINCGIQNEK